ncbi:MAG: MFS transporter [Candidatus Shapirobacteria bacterium]
MSVALHPNILYLTWFNFSVDFTLYGPIAIIYFSQITGSYALALSVFSVEMISSSLFEFPTGAFSDYSGRRKTVIYGAICGVISALFYALGFNYWFLFVGAIFAGLGRAFHSGNNAALLHESLRENSQEEEYSKYSGQTNSMFQLALAISAILGGFVAFWSLSLAVWLTIIPRVIGLVLSLKLVEPKLVDIRSDNNIFAHLKESLRNFKNNHELRDLSVTSILKYGIEETAHQFKPAFIATLWPVWAINISGTLNHLLATFGFRFGSAIAKKYGFLKVLFIGEFVNRIISVVSILMANVISPLTMTLTSFTYGVNSVAQDTLYQKHFSNRQRATMGSLNGLAGSLFFGVFALLFGFVADRVGPKNGLLIGQALMFGVVWLYWRIYKNYAKS